MNAQLNRSSLTKYSGARQIPCSKPHWTFALFLCYFRGLPSTTEHPKLMASSSTTGLAVLRKQIFRRALTIWTSVGSLVRERKELIRSPWCVHDQDLTRIRFLAHKVSPPCRRPATSDRTLALRSRFRPRLGSARCPDCSTQPGKEVAPTALLQPSLKRYQLACWHGCLVEPKMQNQA